MKYSFLMLLIFVFVPGSLVLGEVKGVKVAKKFYCAPVFADGSVLQQGVGIPVWGGAPVKTVVRVQFGGQDKKVTVGEDGLWRVELDAVVADRLESLDKAPEGREMRVSYTLAGETEVEAFKDILVGEVWLCSGQSNMAARVGHNFRNQDPNDNLLKSQLPAIREYSMHEGWRSAVPGKVGRMTRVGFCYARHIQRELKVPVGLVVCATGGSNIVSWMRVPEKREGDDAEAYKARAAGYGILFERHVRPVMGYGIRGALWYQGEANDREGYSYFLKLEAMINDWRGLWGMGDFPFYVVQLAGIGVSSPDKPEMGDGRARIREAQRRVLTMKHTGMAVATDIGKKGEHPANKLEVGVRLAHWGLHHVYGRKEVVPSGPLYKGYKVEGGVMRISFDHSEGLMFGDKKDYVPPVSVPDAVLPWLSIQGKDGVWHWAKARIDGKDLVVSSAEVKVPVAVRYAYTNHPDGVYLYNGAGLPASPFTTEEMKKD